MVVVVVVVVVLIIIIMIVVIKKSKIYYDICEYYMTRNFLPYAGNIFMSRRHIGGSKDRCWWRA